MSQRTPTDILLGIGRETVEDLTHKLGSENPEERLKAAEALHMEARMGGRDISIAVPALAELLSDGDGRIRGAAAEALSGAVERGSDISIAFPVLAKALSGGEERVLRAAVCAFGNASRKGADISIAVPALIAALPFLPPGTKMGVVDTLKEWGPRDYGDLKMIASIMRKVRKEGRMEGDWYGVILVYRDWAEKLGKKADNFVSDKEFPAPKVGKPDGVERVMQVRRVRA